MAMDKVLPQSRLEKSTGKTKVVQPKSTYYYMLKNKSFTLKI